MIETTIGMMATMAICGLLLSAASMYLKLKSRTTFNLGYWFKKNWVSFGSALISTFVLIVLSEPIALIVSERFTTTGTNLVLVVCFIGGFLNHTLLKYLTKLVIWGGRKIGQLGKPKLPKAEAEDDKSDDTGELLDSDDPGAL